jgi:hypothetical protein
MNEASRSQDTRGAGAPSRAVRSDRSPRRTYVDFGIRLPVAGKGGVKKPADDHIAAESSSARARFDGLDNLKSSLFEGVSYRPAAINARSRKML